VVKSKKLERKLIGEIARNQRMPTSAGGARDWKKTEVMYALCRVCRYSLLAIIALRVETADTALGQEKPAEPAVKALNNAVLSTLPFAKRDDYQDAGRGFIATLPDGLVTGPKGNVIWSQKDYAFLEGTPPDTVNPSLWRQAQLNHQN